MRQSTRPSNRIFAALILLVLALAVSASAQTTQRGKVIKISDGDTVVIQPEDGDQPFKCRLYGIDAPETSHGRKAGQPYGEEAAKELKRLILGQIVDVTTTGAKTYNREVCQITKDGIDINLEMVRLGFAWAYVQYLKRPHASKYIDVEREARASKLGLWHDINPTPPWEFRKKQKGHKKW